MMRVSSVLVSVLLRRWRTMLSQGATTTIRTPPRSYHDQADTCLGTAPTTHHPCVTVRLAQQAVALLGCAAFASVNAQPVQQYSWKADPAAFTVDTVDLQSTDGMPWEAGSRINAVIGGTANKEITAGTLKVQWWEVRSHAVRMRVVLVALRRPCLP